MRTFQFHLSPYVLDESKIKRINSIIEEQFNLLDIKWKIEYTAVLKSKKVFDRTKLESLFSMDNSVNDPIQNLYIVAKNSVNSRVKNTEKDSLEDNFDNKYYFCHVDFSTQSSKGLIVVSVDSSDSRWLDSTMLALDEQVERTFQRDFWGKFCNSDLRFVLPFMLLMILMGVGIEGYKFFQGRYNLSERMWLTKDNATQLLSKAEEKLTPVEIYQLQLKNIQYYDQNALGWNAFLSWKFYVLIIPLAFIIIAFFYLILFCYPVAVFNWGDMSGWYEKICRRRKILWEVIMIAIIGGLIVNMAASGLVGLLQ